MLKVLLIALIALSQPKSTEKTTYVNDEYGFSATLPQYQNKKLKKKVTDWKFATETPDGVESQIEHKKIDGLYIHIQLQKPDSLTPTWPGTEQICRNVSEQFLKNHSSSFKSLNKIDQKSSRLKNGSLINSSRFEVVTTHDEKYYRDIYIFIGRGNNSLFVFSVIRPLKLKEDDEKSIQDLLNSITTYPSPREHTKACECKTCVKKSKEGAKTAKTK